MKKISVLVLALVLVFAAGTMASAQVNWKNGDYVIKTGLDLNGTMDIDGMGDADADTALSLTGEYVIPYQSNVDLGVGLTYQLSRTEDVTGEDFNFVPVYGLVKINTTDMSSKYQPYFLAHLGYNFFNSDYNADTDGGLYYAAGAGMKISDELNAELLYDVNKGQLGNDDVKYSKIRLGISYSF